MASSGVSLKWGGFDKALNKFSKKLKSQKAILLEAVGEVLVSGAIKRFQDEEDPKGNKWKPSQRTMAMKTQKSAVKRDAKGRILKGSGKILKKGRKGGGKTLTDTARLRNSITSEVNGDSVLVGSNVKYARIHQLGGMAGKGHKITIPARPYLGISKEDRQEVADTINDFFSGAFK
ncbi:MAG: phage virion morphogenesis protein [Desulfarculales bacterium]|jgi:phage virion morphogenesis protein|nr:phage virion morphogenesis protein [Desulfarculales bacterium]